MKKVFISVVYLIIISALFYCGKDSGLSKEKKMRIKKIAEPITDKILQGLNENDYEKFTFKYDKTMKSAMTKENFERNREGIIEKVGKYVSREFDKIEKQGKFFVVLYNAKFENEEKVNVKVVLKKYGDEYLVSGLWFKSPKLIEKAMGK
jgi:hypothetical protein